MIRMKLEELLKERGQSMYWLSKQSGISYQNIFRMVHHQSAGIRFETIEILCQVLECTPNDLFVIDYERPEGS